MTCFMINGGYSGVQQREKTVKLDCVDLTPSVPSGLISRAFLTKPYAPRPTSPWMTNSEMSRSLESGVSVPVGVGGQVLCAMLKRLPELPDRTSFCGATGKSDGGSMGAMETRPAIRETRCCEERLRGLGEVGERIGGGGRGAVNVREGLLGVRGREEIVGECTGEDDTESAVKKAGELARSERGGKSVRVVMG